MDAVWNGVTQRSENTTLLERWFRVAQHDAHTGHFELVCGSGRMWWDNPLRRLWGLAAGEPAPGVKQLLDAVVAADRLPLRRAWLRSQRDGRGRVTVRVRMPGGLRWLQLEWIMEREAGAPVAAGSVRDVSHERELQSEARNLSAQLDAAAAQATSRGEQLATVGHELYGPLQTIVLATQRLQAVRAGASGEEARWLEVLQEAGAHLRDMAQDMLHGAAHGHDAPAPGAPQAAVGATAQRVLAWLQGQADAAGITLEMDASLDGVRVQASATRLRQVLLNLVGNAIKYGRRGGQVRCSARRTDAGVVLEVEDDGLGMSAEQLQRLAQPFERLGREGSGVEGFGMGAYIVKRLLQDMGGEIRYASTPGQGTRVSVRLPPAVALTTVAGAAAPAPLPLEALPESPCAACPTALRMLVVDDEPLTSLVMQLQLDALGSVAARFVEHAGEAVAAWREAVAADAAPHVLLLDLNVGGVRGETVLQALRAAGCTAPAVAYTADARAEHDAALRAAGFDQAWTKPLDTVELGRRLAALQTRGPLAAGAALKPCATACADCVSLLPVPASHTSQSWRECKQFNTFY